MVALAVGSCASGSGDSGAARPDSTTTASIGTPPPLSEDVIGDWTEASAGVTDGIRWSLFVAPSTDGRACTVVDLDPMPAPKPLGGAPPEVVEAIRSGSGPSLRSEGVSCSPLPRLGDDYGQPLQTQHVHQAERDGNYQFASGLLDASVTSLSATFEDGSSHAATVRDGTFIVFWRQDQQLVTLEFDSSVRRIHCRIQKVTTGPDPIWVDGGCDFTE